ncbi:MAG: acyl-CoA dehydrogenase family protein [Acidimicrobiales bacterium]
MDFGWTAGQQRRRGEAIAFAEEHLNDDLIDRNRDGEWSWDAWRACADFGLFGLVVPEAYGGTGDDLLTAIAVLEGIGYGCRENGLPFAINSQLWSTQPAILKFGTEEQKQRHLTRLVQGSAIGAFGITEVDSGSDSYAMQAKATKVDGGYVLTGTKAYITFAPIADLAVVFASTDPDAGRWGITAFIVERGTDGFWTEPVEEKMGLRTTPFGKLCLEDCFIPTENRLGAEGGGMAIFTSAMESERSYIFASQIGRMERQVEECVAYANNRKAFGKPIGKNQAISSRIADMMVRLETSRNLLYKVAWLEEQGKPLIKEAAMAKLHLSECFVQSSIDAITIHGAKGYATEFEVERDLRDGIGGLLYSGTNDIQRNIVARVSGL